MTAAQKGRTPLAGGVREQVAKQSELAVQIFRRAARRRKAWLIAAELAFAAAFVGYGWLLGYAAGVAQ